MKGTARRAGYNKARTRHLGWQHGMKQRHTWAVFWAVHYFTIQTWHNPAAVEVGSTTNKSEADTLCSVNTDGAMCRVPVQLPTTRCARSAKMQGNWGKMEV